MQSVSKRFVQIFRVGVMATYVALSAGLASAEELTIQEQAALKEIREMYMAQLGRQPTPSEEEKLMDQWRQSVMRVSVMATRMNAMGNGTLPAQIAAASTQAAPSPSLSEDELAQKIQTLGPDKSGATITAQRDGLKINGRSYIDPEGKIASYAFNPLTGDITYSISSGDSLTFRYMKAGNNAEPVTIATVTQRNSDYVVNTATGKKLTGSVVTPMATGLLVYRGGAIFRYEAGKGTRSYSVPEGWAPTSIQRGNVGATGFVLLERLQPSADSVGGLGGLLSAAKSLGAVTGLSKKEDYALLNMENGKLFLLNLQTEGKAQTVHTNCTKKNAYVNECSNRYSYESLYTDIGRNYGHYYWSVDWYMTPSGPIAISMENGQKDVYILDLQAGKKVSAFHRVLGISTLDISQAPGGVIGLTAGWMFKTFPIEDAVKFLAENPPVLEG